MTELTTAEIYAERLIDRIRDREASIGGRDRRIRALVLHLAFGNSNPLACVLTGLDDAGQDVAVEIFAAAARDAIRAGAGVAAVEIAGEWISRIESDADREAVLPRMQRR